MIVELVNTGSELLLGRVLNAHQQWLCRQLAGMGYRVARQTAVSDNAPDIESAIRGSLARADLVIVTGGLGPTSDDRTREVVARLLGRELIEDEAAFARIKTFFDANHRPMPEIARVQALVPEGAVVLPNREGTAPGIALHVKPNLFRADKRGSLLVLLPGPRQELHSMFADAVVPLLRRELPVEVAFAFRTVRTTGLAESFVQERVQSSLAPLVRNGLDVGYRASPGQVDVQLSARGENASECVSRAEDVVRTRLGADVFGFDDEELEQVVIRRLLERDQTLSVAESCTGGCIAQRLTNVPGASAVFRGGWVTYSNEAKQRWLGVRAEVIQDFGAVSEPVAREMAEGARREAETDYAIGVTGIAGPSGGSPSKPVGTVFIALASARETRVKLMRNVWDRVTFKNVTADQALNHLRLLLLETK